MANNEYVNKVQFGNQTVMDISDTTAEANDVIQGQTFYTRSGAPATGTLGDATQSTHGLMSVEDKVKLDNINEIQIDKTIDTPATIMSFPDGADGLPMALTVAIEPVQDLHGYDYPWPAGGGKNQWNGTVSTGNNTFGKAYALPSSFLTFTVSVKNATGKQINYRVFNSSGDVIVADTMLAKSTDTTASATITVAERPHLVLYILGGTDSDVPNVTKVQVESGSAATDYAPYSNICPISGWTGANVTRTGKNVMTPASAETKSNNGITVVSDGKGRYTVTGTATGEANVDFDIPEMTIPISVGSGGFGGMFLFNTKAVNGANLWFFNNNTGIDGWGLTTINRSNTSYSGQGGNKINKVRIYVTNGTETNFVVSPMFTVDGSISASEFEEFTGNDTYQLTFPTSAGTVYGGTLTVNQDGSGELVVDMANVDLGTLEYTAQTPTAECQLWRTTVSGLKYEIAVSKPIAAISSRFYAVKRSIATLFPNMMCYYTSNSDNIILCTNPNQYTDAATFKTAMTGVQLVYELATPVTYSLTPGQVKTLLGVNNIWADTGDINSITYSKPTSGLINTYDKVKLNSLATVSLTGNYNDLLNKPDLNAYLTTVPTMVGATSNAAGTAGLVPAPTTTDVNKFLAGDGTYKSGGLPMVVLSYGSSTWAQFEAAYNNNVIVYCRASSNSDPASGSQTRMAFMAYVNNGDTPTEVEFQYYRSVSSHSTSQMGDQVFIYKLNKTSGWSVTHREASIKEIKLDSNSAGSVSWSSNKVTLDSGLPKVTASDNGKILKVVNGVWTVADP